MNRIINTLLALGLIYSISSSTHAAQLTLTCGGTRTCIGAIVLANGMDYQITGEGYYGSSPSDGGYFNLIGVERGVNVGDVIKVSSDRCLMKDNSFCTNQQSPPPHDPRGPSYSEPSNPGNSGSSQLNPSNYYKISQLSSVRTAIAYRVKTLNYYNNLDWYVGTLTNQCTDLARKKFRDVALRVGIKVESDSILSCDIEYLQR